MRRCVWCDKVLPESAQKGHRRREYCNAQCKQQMYLFHKKMKEDAERAADIYWKQAYKKLAFEYQWVEVRLQNAHKEMEQMQAYIQRLEKQVDDLYTDYRARLKATGMNEADIQDFERYWQEHMKPSFHHDEMI